MKKPLDNKESTRLLEEQPEGTDLIFYDAELGVSAGGSMFRKLEDGTWHYLRLKGVDTFGWSPVAFNLHNENALWVLM